MDATHVEFNQIFDDLIFKPCGMEASFFEQPIPKDLKRIRAVGYTEGLTPYPYRLFPYQAAGGIWITPMDLTKFMITLLAHYHKATNT